MNSYPQPAAGDNPDLNSQLADMSIEQHPVDHHRKSKRPARVFHTEFSNASPYGTQPQGRNIGPSGSPVPFYNSNDFISPIDRAVSAQAMNSPLNSRQQPHPHSHLINQFQLGQEPQPQSFVPPQQNGQFGQYNTENPESADAAIPSITDDRASAQKNLGPNPLFKTFENACPPPVGTDYDVEDQGLSGPQFARLTMYNVPNTDALRASTKLPLGMILRPFAPFSNKEHECGGVSTVDFSDGIPPPRCQRCRTYMNPSMIFTEGGTKFTCNMCQFSNEVSGEYFQPIDATNRRIDWQTRPELAFGTYDMIVSKDYWKEEGIEPSPLHHLVLIDVSRDAIKKELPKLAVEAIRAALYGNGLEPGDDAVSNFSGTQPLDNNGDLFDPGSLSDKSVKYPSKARIGIATYDRTVQFYNLSSSLEQAQMIVMSDIDDPFVPIDDGMFVDPEDSRYVIEDLLDRIDLMFEDNPNEEPVFGCALDVALKALQHTGGKVSAILSSLPSRGPGALAVRDGTPNFTGDKEKDIFNPDSKYYEELGKNYASAGVGLDIFLFPSTFCDLTNTGIVCQLSGGREHFYPRFVPQRDGRRFIAEFCRSCEGEIVTQAQLKVRCSTGLQVAAYYGNFYHDGWDEEPMIGALDSHSTIGILFKYDGKLDLKLDVHFQSALLYTSSEGSRRLRITNVIASVTEQFRPVVNFVDLSATVGIITRDSISRMGESSLKDIRDRMNNRLVDIFAGYRNNVGTSFPANQLLMPMSLRGLILFVLALQKSLPFRDQKIANDSRIDASRLMFNLTPDELNLFLYPRIIGLHNLQPTDCRYSENGLFNMPVNVKASMTALEVGGVYLIYNGQSLLIWIHSQVSHALLKDLFGDFVSNIESLDPYLNELPELDTEVSRQARSLVKYFANKSSTRFLGLQIFREPLDAAGYDFQALMVEDRSMNTFNYVEFVANIHNLVRNKLGSMSEKASKSNFIGEHFLTQIGF